MRTNLMKTALRIGAAVVLFFGLMFVSEGSSFAQPQTITPLSSNACTGPSNDRVCIVISGSGLYTNYIQAQQQRLDNWCASPTLVGPGYNHTFGRVCATPGQNYIYQFNFNQNLGAGSWCIYWSNSTSLRACQNIYA